MPNLRPVQQAHVPRPPAEPVGDPPPPSSVEWGEIGGAIADQTDLQTALGGYAATAHTHSAANIADSTVTGRSVLIAADAAAARTVIGAGTSSFSGAYADLSGKPTLGLLADQDTVTAAEISDSTATGRAVVTAASQAAARTAIGAGTSSFDGAYGSLSGTPGTFAPSAHATAHQAGGGDGIKLDDLVAPDDNTDLNASTSKHGLMMKYPGGTSNFLRADGTFAAPTAAAADPAYAPGSFTIATATGRVFVDTLELTGAQTGTLEGNSTAALL